MKWKLKLPADVKKARTEPDTRVYCIGDIHGRADLLTLLHDMITNDAAGYAGKMQLVYLGDYIDRGEQSREVVELLLGNSPVGIEPIFLMGNHEQTLLDFLEHPGTNASWLSYGGLATLYSYNVRLGRIPMSCDIEPLAIELAENIPREHIDFFWACRESHSSGDYHFVHAGIRPGIAIDQQSKQDRLWIRQDFLFSDANHGAVIVHGHTISDEVEFQPNRIGLDTGAYFSGVLSCLVLEGTERRLLQTGAGLE
jgi:serine/threonine protein phosphatase 1